MHETFYNLFLQVVFHYQSITEPAVIKRLNSQLNKSTGEVVKSRPKYVCQHYIKVWDSRILLHVYHLGPLSDPKLIEAKLKPGKFVVLVNISGNETVTSFGNYYSKTFVFRTL
jgi:hypothetical protein